MNTDRIEKKILLRAPLARVWRAISDSAEFGSWFGMKLEGPFIPGQTVHGVIVPTTVDPKVAEMQKPYEGFPLDLIIERMESERLFSFRWHPGPPDPAVDKYVQYEHYRTQPTTLVTFQVEQQPDGVLLTITETGFDSIPLDRRAKAFASNSQGWEGQLKLIEGYLATAANAAS
jgi:uncharacterized protein YndB with AHSA1/START domain